MIDNLLKLINFFEDASGLNVNRNKSEIIEIHCDSLWIDYLATKYGRKKETWPSTYLGLPLHGKPSSLSFWQPIINKIEKRIQSWQHNHLSKGGRLTLMNATLSNLPTYFLSLFHVPTKVANTIESLYKIFLWSGIRGKNLSHLIKWENVKKPIEEAVSGPLILSITTILSLQSGVGIFKEKEALWRTIIYAKHRSMHFDQKNSWDKGTTSRSHWFYISRHCDLIYNISINIGDGENTSFWDDIWKGDTVNKILFPRLYNIAESKSLSIKEVWDESNTFLIIALAIWKIAGFGITTVLEFSLHDPFCTISQRRTSCWIKIYTELFGHRLAQKRSDFYSGRLANRVSILMIDSKLDVHGSLFLHNGAVFAKKMLNPLITFSYTAPLLEWYGQKSYPHLNGPLFPLVL